MRTGRCQGEGSPDFLVTPNSNAYIRNSLREVNWTLFGHLAKKNQVYFNKITRLTGLFELETRLELATYA